MWPSRFRRCRLWFVKDRGSSEFADLRDSGRLKPRSMRDIGSDVYTGEQPNPLNEGVCESWDQVVTRNFWCCIMGYKSYCHDFDLVEIVFFCVVFTFVLIVLTQACRIMSASLRSR
ncbi:hypothetical protein B5X24_HaOG205320 [Helicoverpa armigera]|uniref:Uncharacterized protein n=1 Tax=Helicoverpa armigera TaxID=29058 RepID=A0A2W1BRY6_HELAM|nr:hypothetical protein B5X24_HaOG205320 [Helicoverpa armigera]